MKFHIHFVVLTLAGAIVYEFSHTFRLWTPTEAVVYEISHTFRGFDPC